MKIIYKKNIENNTKMNINERDDEWKYEDYNDLNIYTDKDESDCVNTDQANMYFSFGKDKNTQDNNTINHKSNYLQPV